MIYQLLHLASPRYLFVAMLTTTLSSGRGEPEPDRRLQPHRLETAQAAIVGRLGFLGHAELCRGEVAVLRETIPADSCAAEKRNNAGRS